jgi:hypothetical protein
MEQFIRLVPFLTPFAWSMGLLLWLPEGPDASAGHPAVLGLRVTGCAQTQAFQRDNVDAAGHPQRL